MVLNPSLQSVPDLWEALDSLLGYGPDDMNLEGVAPTIGPFWVPQERRAPDVYVSQLYAPAQGDLRMLFENMRLQMYLEALEPLLAPSSLLYAQALGYVPTVPAPSLASGASLYSMMMRDGPANPVVPRVSSGEMRRLLRLAYFASGYEDLLEEAYSLGSQWSATTRY